MVVYSMALTLKNYPTTFVLYSKIKNYLFFLIRCGFKIVVPDRKDISLQEKDPQVLETVAVSL